MQHKATQKHMYISKRVRAESMLCSHLLCVELADPGMAAAAASWALRLELPKEGGPIPGPAGWGMLGELGAMGGYTLFWLPGPWLRPTGMGWPGPWPCMGLLAFIP